MERTDDTKPEKRPGADEPPPAGLSATPAEIGDALRAAVERTLTATAGSATETRQRAQSLLDQVVRRGQVAREEVTRRGEEATSRLGDAITDLRSSDEGIRGVEERLASVEERLRAIEALVTAQSKPKVEPDSMPSEPLEQGGSA